MFDLVCPGCRTRTPERLDLHTIERHDDAYVCGNCGRRYPIVDGIPVVIANPLSALEPEGSIDAVESDDEPVARLLDHLSTYLDAHWTAPLSPMHERLSALPHAQLTVELGCSVGRGAYELAARTAHLVALDLHHGAVRRAKRLLDGEAMTYSRRVIGRHYEFVAIPARPARTNVTVLCADALDPPLVPVVFDRVVALNVIDSVPNPRQLLSVIDMLCKPGGEILLASPYAWQSNIMPDSHRFGGNDPAAWLRETLTHGTGLGARYAIEDEADLPWSLRRDARSGATYCIHYVRARQI